MFDQRNLIPPFVKQWYATMKLVRRQRLSYFGAVVAVVFVVI